MAKLTRAMGNRQIDAVFSSLNTGKGIYASEDFDYIAGMAQLKREVKDLLKLTSDPEYRYWLNNLDISEYTKYFKKITELAETFRLQKANQMKEAEFLTLDELSSNFNQETKYDKRIDVINTFSLNDLQRWEKDYADKEAVLSAMIKTGFFESADSDTINKFLTSFSNRDRNAFIQRCSDSPDLLMSIFQKENIKSQKYLLALLLDFGTGSDTDKNTYEIPQGQVFNASFVDSKMYINYMKEVPYEDNMYELDKQVQLPTPFTNVSFFYGENNKITLPAISLIGNMDNRLYDDYYKCNTDISQLTDDEKKELFDEFVDHYLGKAFIAEFLSNPLSLLKTVGLSLATGILLMFASEAVAVGLAIAGSGLGIISSSLDLKSGLEMLESVAELKKNARNVNDYKEAARLLAEAMVKISVNGIMLIVSLIQFGEACGKGFELYYKNKKLTIKKGRLKILPGENHSSSEIKAAQYMADLGNDVILRPPIGTRSEGGTSDLLVNGINYDVYTPTTDNSSAIIRAITKKNKQTSGIVLDLAMTTVTESELGNVLLRVQGAITKNGGICNITDIVIIPK